MQKGVNMKKLIILTSMVMIILLASGCSTWGAIKKDTNSAWKKTKQAVHKATK